MGDHLKNKYTNMTSATPNDDTPAEQQGTVVVSAYNNPATSSVVRIADDTVGVHAEHVLPTVFRGYLDGIKAPDTETLAGWAKRPVALTSGLFTTTDTGILYNNALTTPPAFYTAKWSNVYALRYNVRLILQVNATRFQAGRYILAYIPYGGGTAFSRDPYYRMRIANLTTISQLPHVEIDLAKQTHATLDIPYCHIAPALEFRSATSTFSQSMFHIILRPYVALQAGGGDTTCPYTLWMSFQDIEFVSAAANQGLIAEDQMANIGEKEAAAAGIGPVSGILAKVSTATGIMGQLPLLGPYAMSVSWISDVLSRSAQAMGWSKPLSLAAPDRVVRQVLPFSATSDVSVNGHPLGVSAKNSVISHSGISGTAVDEMSFDFIKSQYAYIQTVNWFSSDTTGVAIWAWDIRPQNFVTTHSKGICPSPVAFLSLFHEYYRGGFKFRFKLVKTEFHRGRLMISYTPYTIGGTASVYTYDQACAVYREIIDISTASEFEVCVPYMSVKPWTHKADYIGKMVVHVENALIAPDTVANNVPVIVEVCGDTDFRVACPTDAPYEPYSPSTNQMADEYVVTPCYKLGVSTPAQDIEAHTIGEVLTSFRQLLKRLHAWNPYTGLVLNSAGPCFLKVYHLFCTTQAATTGGALQRGLMTSDMINLVSWCYAMQTGSMRMTIVPNYGGGNISVGAQLNANSTGYSQYGSFASPVIDGERTVIPTPIEGYADLAIPVWQPCAARAVPCQTEIPSGINVDTQFGNATGLVLTAWDTLAPVTTRVFRSIGEDFSMFKWAGVPPLVLNTAT